MLSLSASLTNSLVVNFLCFTISVGSFPWKYMSNVLPGKLFTVYLSVDTCSLHKFSCCLMGCGSHKDEFLPFPHNYNEHNWPGAIGTALWNPSYHLLPNHTSKYYREMKEAPSLENTGLLWWLSQRTNLNLCRLLRSPRAPCWTFLPLFTQGRA